MFKQVSESYNPKCPGQLMIMCHSNNHEYHRWNEKRQSLDANTETKGMLGLSEDL